MKIAPEGYSYIAFFFLVTIGSFFFLSKVVALVPFALLCFMLFFFRDPDRSIPPGDNNYVSPADGRVILIQDVYEEKFLRDDAVEISIFMSPFNVHINRTPCKGVVEDVRYSKGKFFSAFKPEASLQNENVTILFRGAHGLLLIRQVAGSIARRAVCRAKKGQVLEKGERFGIIKFSSRVDIYLPKETAIKVKLGQKVKAGETIIGERVMT
ncbi:MAG: phosphatidylserine decarboxylase family protein [Thermodesulfovibrionales bacterium]|nr:phosphatidylserine decarboxylase family protein [Thermodesulfovibrionales bacterium]